MGEASGPKLLTVAVAAYNGGQTLAKALDSCLHAEEKRLEVIVVDDGSTDNTLEIAQSYVRRWPDTIRLLHQPNSGYGAAVQAALAAAQGRYFRTLDSDDWFTPQGLAVLLNCLQHCSADLVFTNYQAVKAGVAERFCVCKAFEGSTVYPLGAAALHGLEKSCEIHAMTCRTALLHRARLELPHHCHYTDMLYTFAALQAAETAEFCPVMLYCYRLDRMGQSVDLTSYQRHAADYIRVARAVLRRAEDQAGQDAKTQMLRRRARDIAQYQIELFLRFPLSGQAWRQLRQYDRMLSREFPEISGMMHNKNTRLLRATGYGAYPALWWWTQQKTSGEMYKK